MTRTTRTMVCALVLTVGGCSTPLPTAPTSTERVPTQSNVPATLPNGAYVCSTQPRMYCNATGTACWWEADVYTQTTPCPDIPIK